MQTARRTPLSSSAWMFAAAFAVLSTSAFAQKQQKPPENAMPLSKIVQTIEQQDQFAYFDEIEWESEGYWEVEYYAKDGSKRKVRIDPASGQALR